MKIYEIAHALNAVAAVAILVAGSLQLKAYLKGRLRNNF